MKITNRIAAYCILMCMLPGVSHAQDNNSYQEGSMPQLKSGTKGSTPLIRFTGSFTDNAANPDCAVIYFDSKSTTEYDGQLDALKLMNSDINVPNIYFITPGDINLQIYALPPISNTTCKVPLGIHLNRGGDVTINISDIDSSFANLSISITDMVTGTEQTLLADNKFEINLPAGTYDNRFFLNMSDIKTDITENFAEPNMFSVHYSYGVMKAEINLPDGKNGVLLITNLYGQTISADKIYESGYHELHRNLQKGLYIVTLISDNVKSSKKIFASN
ncbi:MAG: hypothetical protein ABR519_01720 [Bacteroidales bacterium]